MINENIQRIREMRGFTQEHMAESLNMSVSAYGKIERGESGLSFEKAKSISKILGISLNDLETFDDQKCVQIIQPNSSLSNCQQGQFINSGLAENERKLYEEMIALLKDKIQLLEKNK